jgi:hypothetical protein
VALAKADVVAAAELDRSPLERVSALYRVSHLGNRILDRVLPLLVTKSYRITASLNLVADRSFIFLAETPPMEERRKVARKRVFKAGSIEFDGVAVDCIIRNVSPHGATLDVPSQANIPHAVTLNIITRRERRYCQIVWRGERRIGVAFADGSTDLSNRYSIPETKGAQ